MQTYPCTIENGGGETLTFLGLAPIDQGERLEVEFQARPGAGPPMHVHHLQEEGMAVLSGRLGFQILGQDEQFAEAGQTAVFPPGVPHRWWNAGPGARV